VRRPQQHVTADQGVARVMSVCAEAGWATDRVVSDYGEDLIAQTTCWGDVDPFRTLLQVKSTDRPVATDKKIACRVRREHALRWVRNGEPVIVVLWDNSNDKGWYSLPRDRLNEYDLLLSAATTTEIVFASEAAFMAPALDKLGWELRLGYFKQQLLAAARDDYDELVRRADGVSSLGSNSRLPVVILNLFRLLHITTNRGLNPEIRPLFLKVRRKVQERERAEMLRNDRSSPKELDNMAAILAVLVHIERLTGVATPTVVAQYASEALLKVLKGAGLPAGQE